MKILFHLGHPAHFHLFKHVIRQLKENGHKVHILIKEKDVLQNLVETSGYDYINILPEGKSAGRIGLVNDLVMRGRRIAAYCREVRPDLLLGTSTDISYVGRLLGIPSINVNEDDADVVPMYAWLAYPMANHILSPDCCNNGRWAKKTDTYAGYHELAYLHPDLFTPSAEITSRYTNPEENFFILRFAGLEAHHDKGVRGIDNNLAIQLADYLKPFGSILVTSERELIPELEPYRFQINPEDMHHLLAFAKLVVGDSQTMSAEAAVLGTPYIRFNDFVGKIGYLRELEERYQLGFGITPDHPKTLLKKAKDLAALENSRELFEERRQKMLSEKINVADFLYEYILGVLNKR